MNNIPIAVGTAKNLQPRQPGGIGDPSLENNVREFYRREAGRWNRWQRNVLPGETVKVSSNNLAVVETKIFVFPITPGSAVSVYVWESSGANGDSSEPTYAITNTETQTFPGLDDRTYWDVKNDAVDTARVAIFYKTSGERK